MQLDTLPSTLIPPQPSLGIPTQPEIIKPEFVLTQLMGLTPAPNPIPPPVAPIFIPPQGLLALKLETKPSNSTLIAFTDLFKLPEDKDGTIAMSRIYRLAYLPISERPLVVICIA